MITDKTGRKLKLGQLVDIPANSMMTGQVIEINESTLALPGNQQAQPYVIVQLMPVQMRLARKPNGDLIVPDAYVVADAPPQKGVGDNENKDDNKDGKIMPFKTGMPS